MSNKQFISNLSSTYADVRKLDVKKINLKGKNILEYINGSTSTPTIKHANDTRETVTENDLWGQWVETKADGTIIVHDDWVTNSNGYSAWNSSIGEVVDNKAYTSSGFYANIQTEKIKSGEHMFSNCSKLTSFYSDLSSLTNGEHMFNNCSNLVFFYSDTNNTPVNLSSLTNGEYMFSGCSNLNSFYSDLPSLTKGGSMFSNCSKLTLFYSNLSNLTNGNWMFYNCPQLKVFYSDSSGTPVNLSSLTKGYSMFSSCSNLESFQSDLPNMTDGNYMFDGCSKLKSFSSDLSSLTYGANMFGRCTNLTSFSSNLSSLSNGDSMFEGCSKLTLFSSDLSSLTHGFDMFKGCSNLTSFNSDLSSLTYAERMFWGCSKLSSFSSDLSSLTAGDGMFVLCRFDAKSVMYIADTIKDITTEKQLYINGTIPYVTLSNGVYSAPRGFMSDGRYIYTYNSPRPFTALINAPYVGMLTLGINVTNNSSTIQQQLENFAKETTFGTWSDLKKHFSDKGWKVTFIYGGTNTLIPDTYDLTNGEQIIPCQIFAKLIEIEPQGVEYDEDGNVIRENFYTDEQIIRASYCNDDASTFYNIEWGHDVTDTTDYTQFNSLEDAMTSWNVFPKENIISTEE